MPRILFNLTIFRNDDGTLDYNYTGNPKDPFVDLGLSHFIEEQLPEMPEEIRRGLTLDGVEPDEDLWH